MYIPLYNKSNYTLLSSLLKIDDIVDFAVNNNISSIALSDSNMYGVMEFINKCRDNNIKPIVGLELALDEYKIVVYAKDYAGYQSLMKLSTIQSERVIESKDIIESKNIIGVLLYKYRDKYNEINKNIDELYLAYSNKSEEKEALVITKNIIFFRENLYLNKNDQDMLPYLYRIRDGKTIIDDVNYDIDNHELNINNILDLSDNNGLLNTYKLADSCEIVFPPFKNLLPIYECDNPSKYLFELCKVGLKKRLNGKISDIYKNRLTHELKIIDDMGFPNYFLVVYDYIKFAKKNNILVGPGRGSAVGSLVAYSLGITDIDPIEYDLLFERFLNPERKTMPDIDTDFPDNKRDIVIDYVREKYGNKRVAGIIAFGTLAAKQAIRDTSRVLNIPLYKVDSLCKLISNDEKKGLKEIYKDNLIFKTRVDSDSSLADMIKIAIKLEGFPRHISQHASGIVMSQMDLDLTVPLVKVNGMYLTSYSMEYLENLGLLKMDFLVIKNLTLIDNIINDIKKIEKKDVEFSKIPLNDPLAIKLFEDGDTCGIFQFESDGMKNFLKKLRPNNINDIIAAIALFRPGAASSIDTYIRRKHGEEKIEYLDPSLESITKSTYGILIYQEQIIMLANLFAGYSLGEADILRRAMSKKKIELLKDEEEKFIKRSMERGHTLEKSKEIFNLVLQFAGYGFNKSHSVVYSIFAYRQAYLKAYYKTIYFANILTNVIGSFEKTNEYILEAKKEGITIEKPTINNSSDIYKVSDNKIIYPLSNIKSIGNVIVEQINNAKKDGEFSDIFDCFSRLYIAGIGKKTFEVLIYANVFCEFDYNRKTLIDNLDNLFNYAELTKDIDPSLVMKPDIEKVDDYDSVFLLDKEKEVFGFYLSAHPTTLFRSDYNNCIMINDIEKYFDKTIECLLLIDRIKVTSTKKNENMAFVTGSDESGSADFVLFPKVYNNYSSISSGNILKIVGNVEKRFNSYQIIVNKIDILQGDNNDKEK